MELTPKQKTAYNMMFREYPDLLDIVQLSSLLKVSTKTAYSLLKKGEIVGMKVGRAYKIPKINVIEYLKL